MHGRAAGRRAFALTVGGQRLAAAPMKRDSDGRHRVTLALGTLPRLRLSSCDG
jgi:hypothetical protein